MSYKCAMCKSSVTITDTEVPLVYRVRRGDGGVPRELRVCAACKVVLDESDPVKPTTTKEN